MPLRWPAIAFTRTISPFGASSFQVATGGSITPLHRLPPIRLLLDQLTNQPHYAALYSSTI